MPAQMITVKHDDSTTEQLNPEYTKWVTRDQALLGYIFSTLTREVLMSVMTHSSSAGAWGALDEKFTSRTCAQSVNTRIALTTMKKGTTTLAEYYTRMKHLADEMATTGQQLGDEEFVAYVLTGLDEELYNSLVSSIVTRVEPISPSELFS
jgi:hypothetical protein